MLKTLGDNPLLTDIEGYGSDIVGKALAPVIKSQVEANLPAVQNSIQSGVTDWLKNNEGTLIVGALALTAIIVGIFTIGRSGRSKVMYAPAK